jgi:hypothetical protein
VTNSVSVLTYNSGNRFNVLEKAQEDDDDDDDDVLSINMFTFFKV